VTRLPALGPRGEGWVAIQGVLLAASAVAGAFGPAWDGGVRVATAIGGIVLSAGGVTLAIRGARDLGDALTPLPYPRDHAELVQSGIYAHVRHPIYGGLVLLTGGWGFITASPAALIGAAIVLGFFELKSRREEVWLERRFVGYDSYREHTRRLIPWVG